MVDNRGPILFMNMDRIPFIQRAIKLSSLAFAKIILCMPFAIFLFVVFIIPLKLGVFQRVENRMG